jgi:hypothetical protein
MYRSGRSLGPKRILIAVFISLFVAGAQVKAQAEKDPHRQPCVDVYCKKIKSFVRKHYCGESPFGNGPDDGCDLRFPKKPGAAVDVKAAFKCEWNVSKQAAQCEQHGQPPSVVRNFLIQELRQAGLPAKANGQTYFTVWESTPSGWTVAEAYYSHSVGSDIELCQVILLIDQNSRVIVLRKLPFQKTDVDVPVVTQWSLIDFADAGGDGQVYVILEGDAYEDHWLEVVSLKHGSPQTVFSGLGYWL